jgi:hypothetical protein
MIPWPAQFRTIIDANSTRASSEASSAEQADEKTERLRRASPSKFNEPDAKADSPIRARSMR